MPKAPHYPVPALEKGLDILEAVAAAAMPLSLAELAARLNRSSSELFRMLNCLEARGFITRDELSGKYAMSLRLYSLAHSHSVTEKLLQAARKPMQELTESTRESCHLSLLERDRLVVVKQQESPVRVRITIEVGATFDALATASGRLLLAQLGDDEREQAIAASASGTGLSAREKAALQQTLAAIRREGLSAAESETIEGVRDLAVLVGEPSAGLIAALAVTRLMRRGERANEARLVAAMRAAAAEVTRALGLGPIPMSRAS